MEKWEYQTRFFEARVSSDQIKSFVESTFNKKARRYSPEAMIPELNALGNEGWEIIHMEIPASFRQAEHQAFQLLARALSLQDDQEQCCRLACQALTAACHASDLLMKSYTDQRMAVCHRAPSNPPAPLGCALPWGEMNDNAQQMFCSTFQAAAIPIEWKRVEPVEVDRLDQALLAAEVRVDAGRGAPRELGDVAHGERRRPLALQHLERRGHESITHRAGRLG